MPSSVIVLASVSAVLATGMAILAIRQRRLSKQTQTEKSEARELINRLRSELAEDKRLRETEEEKSALLRKHYHTLTLAADLSDSGSCLCDADGLLVWVNKSWEKATGYTLAEVMGKKPGQVLQGPESDLEAIDRVRHAIKERRPITEEMRNYRKNGEAIWIRLTITPLITTGGKLEGFFGSITDLTNERVARDHLIYSNEKSELALAAGNFGVWEWLPLANVCTWDERTCQLYGVEKPVANYEQWMACVHRGDVEALETRLRSALLGNSPLDAIFRVAGIEGAARYLSIRGLIVRDRQQQPQRIIGIVRDNSDDIALRDQLQLAGERLHLSLMGANDGVWDWHVEEDRMLMDEHWASLTGTTATGASIPMQALTRQLHPEDLPLFRAALNGLRTDSQSRLEVECRVMDGNGRWAWIHWRGTVVSVDLEGAPLRVCGTYSDVTLARHNEEALRRSALLLRQMCQQMGIAAWELDASSFIMAWTEELDLLHSPQSDFEPSLENLLKLYPQDARRELSRALENAIEKREKIDLEVRWQSPGSGQNQWYRWTGGPMIEGDQVCAVCGLIQDVSASRETAAQRRELDSRMAELHQYEALSAITDDLAYDLNSLLSGMLGFQELACDTLPVGHEARTYLLEAMRTGNRTHDIIRQVLLLNRVKPSARIGLRPHLIIEEACDRLRGMLPDSVHVEQKLDRHCPSISGDAAQLQQAFLHIVNQAATVLLGKGGTIQVQLDTTEASMDDAARLGLALTGDFMTMRICATGPDFSEEDWLRLFTHPSRDPGMQITSARKIIAEHQGTLHLSHDIAKGGLCEIWLPLSRTLQHHPPSAAPVPLGSGEMVWIVDDERFIARLAKLSLERNGYAVKLFRTPQDFLVALKEEPSACQVVLLGNVLLGGTLNEVLISARAIKPSIRVVCLGGLAAAQGSDTCSVLVEPFTAADLARSVHDALNPVPQTMNILGRG